MTPEQLKTNMRVAIQQCVLAMERRQGPFGAAIFDGQGELVAADHNRVQQQRDPSAHGEVVTIRKACEKLRVHSLPRDFWLFTTGEPCPMCAATIVFTGLGHVVFGANIAMIRGVGFTELQRPSSDLFQHASKPPQVIGGVLAEECNSLLQRAARG
ncbi:MAG: nucleoside deaminase [Planctomycetota bacterium]